MHKHDTATTKPPYLMNSLDSCDVRANKRDESKRTIKLLSVMVRQAYTFQS